MYLTSDISIQRSEILDTSTQLTGARFLAETLKSYGVTHVFYVEAILRRTLIAFEQLGIQRIVTHGEKAAAYMADGYARAARRPGVCMAQSVGAGNLAAGLQDAFLGHSPVVAITGQKPPIARYRNAYQEVLHHPYFVPVTKYNVEVNVLEQLPYLLRQAFREATTGAPGPVHLDVYGILGEEIEQEQAELEVLSEPLFGRCPALRPAPDPKQVEAAAGFLQAAEHPVIVAGNGAAISDASAEIQALAEKLAIPVATSVSGNGLMPADHPLSLGAVGTYSRWCANRCVAEADLVVFVGSGAGDQITNNWTLPRPGTRVIQVDIDPAELGRNYPNLCSLAGDAKVTVAQLTQAVANRKAETAWSRHAAELVRAWRAELEPAISSDDLPIRPERLCREISLSLPEDAILVSCTGNSAIWSGTLVDLTKPNQRYIRAAGGSLGWAFPASLGVKCGCPDRPVICFTGDGGLYYHLSELETAARWGISTVVVVNNNGGYGQCLRGIRNAYGDLDGHKEDLFRFQDVNLAKLARTLGCEGTRVEHPAHIAPAITEAIQMNRPALVEVMTDINCLSPIPWKPQ
jgi:acetolactate synthase-1/2/3 large subunit